MSKDFPLQNRKFAAFLFDMDGTILSSIAAAERVWAAWATRHGLDVDKFLPTIHGVRAIDTIRRQQLPGVDVEAEAAALTLAEIEDVEGINPIDGAKDFLASLEHWAIVTSAPRALALRRIEAAGLPLPPLLISAEDVVQGKPAPEGFLLAAKRLNVNIADCLVFEDAPAGITSAEAAGATVLVITATHSEKQHHQHPSIDSYQALLLNTDADGYRLEFK